LVRNIGSVVGHVQVVFFEDILVVIAVEQLKRVGLADLISPAIVSDGEKKANNLTFVVSKVAPSRMTMIRFCDSLSCRFR